MALLAAYSENPKRDGVRQGAWNLVPRLLLLQAPVAPVETLHVWGGVCLPGPGRASPGLMQQRVADSASQV